LGVRANICEGNSGDYIEKKLSKLIASKLNKGLEKILKVLLNLLNTLSLFYQLCRMKFFREQRQQSMMT
jgi:hypothetical protein